jgi:predicted outer membrane repeat protein
MVTALLLALVQVVPSATTASSNTLYVGQVAAGSGSCSGPDFSSLDSSETDAIQDAIDEAYSNPKYRFIVICEGVYNLDATLEFEYNHRPVELRGEGSDNTIIDGGDTHRLIDANGKDGDGEPGPRALTLTIRDIGLRNGYTAGFGAGIWFNGRLNLFGVELYDNVADAGGSAIDNDGGGEIVDTLYLINSLIYENVSLGDGGEGGAVLMNGGSVVAANSTFTDNTVDGTTAGGAIHAKRIRVQNSEFHSNSALFGGAIYASASLFVDQTSFTDNSADYDGGAIYTQGHTKILRSQFNSSEAGGYGGAISFDNGEEDLRIEGSTFEGNSAVEDGGAISFYPGRNLGVRSSDFLENLAGEAGGAIYTYDAAQVSIVKSDFGDPDDDSRGNSTLTHGGDIASETGGGADLVTKMRIADSNFSYGHADGLGGSMFLQCTEAVLTRVTVKGATSDDHGAGLYAEDGICSTDYYVTVFASRFLANVSNIQGGALASEQGGAGALLGFKIFNSHFEGNEADSGAAINVDDRILEVTNSTFQFNHVTTYGGAIELSGADVTITRSTFLQNEADVWGGAIMANNSGTLRIISSRFIDNYANSNYGALGVGYAHLWSTTLTSNIFRLNEAAESGGAFGVTFESGTIDLNWLANWKRNIFEDNQAVDGDHVWLNYDDDSEQSSPESLFQLFTERNGIIDPQDGWLHQS